MHLPLELCKRLGNKLGDLGFVHCFLKFFFSDEIHKEFPDAKLRIFYGRETWGNWSVEKMNQISQRIDQLKSKGVSEEGMVGHLKLAEALKNAGILLYPCQTYSETFCIAVVVNFFQKY